jgi:hypothetical protein
MLNNSPKFIQAISSGDVAAEILAIDREASVIGITSKGIFLETSSRWLVFLSFERFRSPLTVNLAETHALPSEVKPKMRVEIVAGMLNFKDINLAIATQNSQMWRAELPMAAPLLKSERLVKLTSYAEFILAEKQDVGLSQILATMFKSSDVLYPDDKRHSPPRIDVSVVQRSIANREPDSFTRIVSNLLGAGEGLTPSGDDFVTGLLLALNRWEAVLWPEDGLEDVCRQVVGAAYRMTTRLSANLIELAAHGKGDERMINVLDLLMTGIPNESEAIRDLLDWGHSSGVDAFVGMAIALSA